MITLEEIIKRYNSATTVVYEGLDVISVNIQDLNWLIEQTKRLEKLKKEKL